MRRVGVLLAALLAVLALLAYVLVDWGGRPPLPPPAPAPQPMPAATTPPRETPAPVPPPIPPSIPEAPKEKPEPPLAVRTNVPGARVTVWFQFSGEGQKALPVEAKTDERGLAEIPLPFPRGTLRYAAVTASSPGWTTVHAWSKGEDLELRLETGFDVSGRVTFPDGRPARGVRLSTRGRVEVATDEAGRYVLDGLPEGEVEIESHDLGESRKVAAGATGVDFVMKRHVVQLRVRDEEGRFVPVECFDLKTTGEGGVWAVGGLPEDRPMTACVSPGGKLSLSCRAVGYMNEVVETTFGEDPDFHEILVVMKRPGPPGTIVVRVRTDGDSRPTRAIVSLSDSTGLATAGYSGLKVDLDDGKGVLPGIPRGAYRAQVRTGSPIDPEEFGLPEEKEVTVEAGKETPLDVVIKSGGRLQVTVNDAKGAIAVAEGLELADLDGKEVKVNFGNRTPEGMTIWAEKAEPAYGDRPIPPGRYSVRITRYVKREKIVLVEKEITVLAGKTVEVEIRLPE